MATVLDDFSMEMTGKDVAKLENAAGVIPPGTRIHVTFLENEDLQTRVTAAAAVKRLGFTPVWHGHCTLTAKPMRVSVRFIMLSLCSQNMKAPRYMDR